MWDDWWGDLSEEGAGNRCVGVGEGELDGERRGEGEGKQSHGHINLLSHSFLFICHCVTLLSFILQRLPSIGIITSRHVFMVFLVTCILPFGISSNVLRETSLSRVFIVTFAPHRFTQSVNLFTPERSCSDAFTSSHLSLFSHSYA